MNGNSKAKKKNKIVKEVVSITISAVLALFVFVVVNFV